MRIVKKKRKSKLSKGMMKALKKVHREVDPVRNNHTDRLEKRGYLKFGSPTEKSETILRVIFQQ